MQVRANGHTIALSTSCSLNTTTQYSSDSKTKDEAIGPGGDEPEYVDWSLNGDSLIGISAAEQLTYEQLMDLQLSLTVLDVEFFLAADGAGAVPDGDWTPDKAADYGFAPYGGKATIESISANAPTDGKASYSVAFKPASALKKITYN